MQKFLCSYLLTVPTIFLGANLALFTPSAKADTPDTVSETTQAQPLVVNTSQDSDRKLAFNSSIPSENQTTDTSAPKVSDSRVDTNAKEVSPAGNVPIRSVSDSADIKAEVTPATPSSIQYLDRLNNYATEGKRNDPTAQVTSVSQLTDVKPTDWAFTALQSLVERYGCIAGYPDRTYKGQRAMTRYEFAAGLNACLDKINEIISSGLADKVSKEDFAAVQKLQEEFAAELAALKGRVDSLEAKTAQLEAQQFSTTTKLQGLAVFNLTGATAGNNLLLDTGVRNANGTPQTAFGTKPNTTLGGLVWLTLNTSFTGSDVLTTTLAVGNATSPANNYVSAGLFNSMGVPFLDQTAGVNPNEFILRELFYKFPIFDGSVRVTVGPRVNWYRLFEQNRFTFFLTGAGSFNSINSTLTNPVKRGAGAAIEWAVSDQFELSLAYLAESQEFLPEPPFGSASNPREGLFGGTNSLTAQLTFKPSKDINLRLLYSRSNIQAINGLVGGTANGQSLPGLADDGFGGALNNGQSDVFTFNFDWLVAKGFGLFGRYGYGTTNLNPANPARSSGSVVVQTFQAGLAFPDLFKEGALGTISFVMPWNFTGGRNFLVSGAGDGGTEYDLEAAYYFPMTKNIALIPSAYFIFQPNNFSSNPTIFVGNLRMQFTF